MRIVCFWSTLMRYAQALGKARATGNEKEIKKAEQQHDTYKNLCLQADEMILD